MREEYDEMVCLGCGEKCQPVKEYIHYSGTHCTHGKSGRHWTGFWVSDCCGDDVKYDYEVAL